MIYFETISDGFKTSGAINSGKKEGIGAIVQYQLLLYAICKKLNVEFYNSGFKNIGHSSYSNYSQEEWDNLFTHFFNLSTTQKIETQLSFNVNQELFSFIEKERNSPTNFLIYVDPEEVLRYGQSIINEIYEKEYLKQLKYNFVFDGNYFSKEVLNVCFHIRSINPEDICFSESRELFDNKKNINYINLITSLKNICDNENVHLHIHSQGSQENFLDIINLSENNFEIFLHLNEKPVSDIYHMSHADLLIMSNSSYSWICHLLNYNVSLVRDNFWHSTYPNTLMLSKDYLFQIQKLKIV